MLYFPLALRKKPTKMAPASQKDDPKDTGAIPALPVLLRFLLSIGKKCNASDMLDDEDVQASSRTLKRRSLFKYLMPVTRHIHPSAFYRVTIVNRRLMN